MKAKSMIQAIQALLIIGGFVLIAWGLTAPGFRHPDGFPAGNIILATSTGIGLIILGAGLQSRMRPALLWFVLALVGHAVALQMIDAGPKLHYQHYRGLSDLLKAFPAGIIFLALQTVLVSYGLARRVRSIFQWVKNQFKPWQVIILALMFLFSSAALSRSIFQYLSELLFAAGIQLVFLGNVLLAVMALPENILLKTSDSVARLVAWRSINGKFLHGVPILVILGALWVFLLTALLSHSVYQRFPHIPDELLYNYQARYFAEGMLTTPAFPVPAAYNLYLVPYQAARWYSPFPPGWPALLALGVMVNLSWLVNPILASINVLLAYWLIRDLYDDNTALASALLLCISPWFIFMGMNLMAHTFQLTLTLVAIWGIVRARNSQKTAWGATAGVAVGLVTLVRPLDGLMMAIVLGLWAIGLGGKRLSLSALAGFVLGVVGITALSLPYNQAITGDSLKFPLNAYYEEYFGPKTYALGFGPDRGLNWEIDPLPGYAPIEAVLNAALNTFSVNIELFGWATGSILLVAVFLVSGKMNLNDKLMLAWIGIIIALYALFWYSGGPDFGARYWYVIIIPLIVLTVRAVIFLADKLVKVSDDSRLVLPSIAVALAILSIFALLNYIPWRAFDKYYHYELMSPGIERLAAEANFGSSIVLIQGDNFPDYAAAWVYNPLTPDAPQTIYAYDGGADIRAQILAAYPDRPVWIVAGPTLTNGSYRVLNQIVR